MLLVLGLLCLCPAPSGAGQPEPLEMLALSIKELGLGEGDFVIGAYLTDEQNRQARKNLLPDTYPGTIKFPSADVVVVVDEKTLLILAVYKRLEEIHTKEVKQMIGYLMTRFGEPTSIAHDKLIYWAYSHEGKIADKTFSESKSRGKIDILATVKFSSTIDLNVDMDNPNTEESGTIYYIIASDRLLNRYISNQ